MKKVNVFSQVLIKDMNSDPVAVLKMRHSVGKMPNLVNQKSLIFITLLSFLFYIIYRLISITIIIPVKKLARDIKMLDEKNQHSQLSENFTVKELITVSKNVNELMFTVQKQNELLAKQVITDPLTQIMNRHGLKTELDDYQERCVRLKVGFIVVMCDVDYFKNYNDSLGHMKGDETLFEIAQALDKQCHRFTEVCARFGGEEFILLFSEMSEQDLKKKMHSIIRTMEIHHFPHPKSPTAAHVTLSMGATIVLHTDVVDFSLPINEIIKTADKALYQAKALGRNCFVINYFSTNKLGLC